MTRTSNRRNNLMQAAFDLTKARSSLKDWTLADLAHEANVPLGNVYYHFKTKKSLQELTAKRLLAEHSTGLDMTTEDLKALKTQIEARLLLRGEL